MMLDLNTVLPILLLKAGVYVLISFALFSLQGQSRCFGFVKFRTVDEANRYISVFYATEQFDHSLAY